MTTCRLSEVGLAHVESIVETGGVLRPSGFVHVGQNTVELLADVLANTLLKQICDRLVQELVLVAQAQTGGVEVVGEIKDTAIPDGDVAVDIT